MPPLAEEGEARAAQREGGGGGGSSSVPPSAEEGEARAAHEAGAAQAPEKEGGGGVKKVPPPAEGGEAEAAPRGEEAAKAAERGHGGGSSSVPPPSPTSTRARKERKGVAVATIPSAARGAARGLCVGSADPHCLWDPGEVAEPKERAPATFGMGMMEKAPRRELAARQFTHFNEAPRTDWREAPVLSEDAPPSVTKLTDVVPQGVLREVLRWTHRVDACLKAAARGNVRLAKQLRPDDRCFDEGHMVEGTEAWVWDLRPLQYGQPAVPLWPSGEGRPPDTDLDLKAVREAGIGFADQAIISELINGVSDDAPLGGAAVLSPPHEGALQHYAQVALKLEKDKARGWSSGGWTLPFWPIRSNAYSIVVETRGGKTKHRMVIDLSWPRWEGGVGRALSVNASIDRSEWPAVAMPRPMQIAEAAAILMAAGGRAKVWGCDCEAYYRKVGRQRAEIYRNCLRADGGFVVDPREQFGDASAAVKCVRLSGLITKEIHKEMRRVDMLYPPREEWVLAWLRERPLGIEGRSSLGFFGMFVDDGAGGSLDDNLFWAEDGAPVRGIGPDEMGADGAWRGRHLRRAELHFAHAIFALHRLGEMSEPSKEQRPGDTLETLGCEISLLDERIRLTDGKRARYAEESTAIAAEAGACATQQLEEVTHKLLYAASVFPRGRQWLHCLFRALKARYRTSRRGVVPVSKKMRRALWSWAAELRRPGHEGVPLASPQRFPAAGAPGVVVTYSDASGDHGFGAWAWAGGRRVLYTCETWGAQELARHINLKELVAMAASTEAFIERWRDATHVREFTDNTCAEWAAHSATPRTEGMQDTMARRVAGLMARGVYTCVARVATKENVWADWLSREGGEAKFLRQAAEMGVETEKIAAAPWWRAAMRAPRGDATPAASGAETAGAAAVCPPQQRARQRRHGGEEAKLDGRGESEGGGGRAGDAHFRKSAVPSVGAASAPARERAQLAELKRGGGREGLRAAALRFIDHSYHDKKGADGATGVRWWRKFCGSALGEAALRV